MATTNHATSVRRGKRSKNTGTTHAVVSQKRRAVEKTSGKNTRQSRTRKSKATSAGRANIGTINGQRLDSDVGDSDDEDDDDGVGIPATQKVDVRDVQEGEDNSDSDDEEVDELSSAEEDGGEEETTGEVAGDLPDNRGANSGRRVVMGKCG